MEDDVTLDAVRALTLPRYRLADYDDPKAAHTKDDAANLADIRSGRGNVSGFVRTSLFKRLSSSGHSFIVSLQRQRARNELFVHAIDHDLPIPLGTFMTDRYRSPTRTSRSTHHPQLPRDSLRRAPSNTSEEDEVDQRVGVQAQPAR